MAESGESPQVRPPEPITISIKQARNLRGSKGDVVSVMVKVEFGDKMLGESPKIDCTAESPAEFNFSAILSCTFEDSFAIDEIAHKPVVLTIIEVLPKEKKQKEEKTSNIGQCTVDLLFLVKGETHCKCTLTLNPLPGTPSEALSPENPYPEIDVEISVNEPLVDKHQLQEGNLLTITVESLFSPPDVWQMTGPQYFYVAALPIPTTAEKEAPVVFVGGSLKPGTDKELPNKQKKWAAPGSAMANSIYISDSFISSDPVQDEDGDFKNKEDHEHRQVAEAQKLRVTWNTERRCFIEPVALKMFQESVAKSRFWPVEIFRLPQPFAGKGKKEDEGTISFHGVSFLNLSPLLYPGVKRLRGAFKVLPYTDHLLQEKTHRKTGISEDACKVALNQLYQNSSSPAPKKVVKEADKKAEPKKGRSSSVLQSHPTDAEGTTGKSESGSGSERDSQTPVNVEGQLYADSKSYLMIELSLSKPLVPKRAPEEVARRVAELVPPRPAFPKRTDSADRAVEDFHQQVASVAALVLEEFREMFGEEMNVGGSESTEAMEERRQKLMYHLNSSGKYFAFKEQLKYSVIKIVREKYLRTTNFDDRQELQRFLSELYVYLVDQMHQSLNQVLQVEDQPPVPPPLTTSAQLKHFAREAEVNRNFSLAAKYYQERIIRDELNAENWFDYGTFCLHINDVAKAEECFNKCISLDQKYVSGLLLCGIVSTLLERNEAAETFFEAATNVDPKNILVWTMLGLFYDAISNDIGAEMAYLEANKLNVAQARALREADLEKERTEQEKEKEKEQGSKDDTPVSSDLESTRAAEPAAEFTFTEAGVDIPMVEVKQASPDLGRTDKRTSLGKRGESKQQPGKKKGKDSIPPPISVPKSLTPSRPGSQVLPSVKDVGLDQEVDEAAVLGTIIPTTSIFMQAVDWLLDIKAVHFTELALGHELLTAADGKTFAYYIADARLKIQKQEYDEAEKSLNEALQIDFQNPDGWALMGHLKYLMNETDGARECYERTLSFVTEASEIHSTYLRLASIYLQDKEFAKAKVTFLMACKSSPSSVSWLGTGIACYRLDELGEAEDALMEANILNNKDPEVWGYLSLVCLRTGRKVEAEQSYKYAIKLNLEDKNLLEEIHAEQKKAGFGNPEY